MINIRPFTLSLVFLIIIVGQVLGQKRTFHCRKTQQVIEFIKTNHFNARPVDKVFNDKINNDFISTLDPVALFFTEEDVAIIKSYCPDLVNLDCSENKYFMEYIVELYRNRLQETPDILDIVLSNSLNFHLKDTLFVADRGKTTYPVNLDGLEKNWNSYIRFQLLRHYMSGFKASDSTVIKNEDDFQLNLVELKADIRRREECRVNHLLNYPGGFSEYIFSIYLNTLTGSFDPHTNYFSLNDKEQFESSISKSKISFGADLEQNDNGEIVISRLIPGGPAWRSGELNPGDVLLNMSFPNKEPIDLLCSNLGDITNIIYNSGASKVELTVRSKLGQVKTLNLKIESLASAENSVYSFILEGDKKIGYISLPGFYTEPDKDDPLGCASDLAIEIQKLSKDGIQGLMLDVRNNGGGSIVEAVDLAGIFIDSGPLCIYTSQHEKPTLIKDLNRGALYEGPLILLVNGYSASASEILGGMLKDYNRALIVGTPTFGKASGQLVIPLGEPGEDSYYFFGSQPTDYIKITTTRYYRLNGCTHQALGLQPDITLPIHAGYARIKESEYESAFINDTIQKDISFEPFPPFPLEILLNNSNERVSRNKNFNEFIAINDSIRPLYVKKIFIPLSFDSFYSDYTRNIGYYQQLDSLKATPGEHYTIMDNSTNKIVVESDSYKKEIHLELIKNLKKDFYLEESYLIMNDMINQKKTITIDSE